MANFTDLPSELHQWVCEHLDPEDLRELALVYHSTSSYARGIINNNIYVDLSSGKVQGVHRVMAFLISQAHSTTQPPNVAITSTGDVFTDRTIKFAFCIKTITLSLRSTKSVAAPVTDQQLKRQYMWLASHLEAPNTTGANSWDFEFCRGGMDDMMRFLLQITCHVTTLEFRDSLQWMTPAITHGLYGGLRTLKLVDINGSWVPWNCTHFARLPSLKTLEFASMEVTMKSVQMLGNNLSVSCLRFTNCHVTTFALIRAVHMCTALKEFEYSLGHTFWTHGVSKDYDLARLLCELRSRHAITLTDLTIRTVRCHVADRCHYAEEIAQLTALKTFTINQDFRHFLPHNVCLRDCFQRYHPQSTLFTANYSEPPTPAEIFLSFPNSLEKIDFHVSSQFQVPAQALLRKVSREGKALGRFPNLGSLTFS
jgi:hypothetical protein